MGARLQNWPHENPPAYKSSTATHGRWRAKKSIRELRRQIVRSVSGREWAMSRGNNPPALERFLLDADDPGETDAGQQLHVEDLLSSGLKFQQGDGFACAQVDHSSTALEVRTR